MPLASIRRACTYLIATSALFSLAGCLLPGRESDEFACGFDGSEVEEMYAALDGWEDALASVIDSVNPTGAIGEPLVIEAWPTMLDANPELCATLNLTPRVYAPSVSVHFFDDRASLQNFRNTGSTRLHIFWGTTADPAVRQRSYETGSFDVGGRIGSDFYCGFGISDGCTMYSMQSDSERCPLAFVDGGFYGVPDDDARQILGDLTDGVFDYLEAADSDLICPDVEFERTTYLGPPG